MPVLGLWPSRRAMPALGKRQRLPSAGAGASSLRPAFLCVHMFLLLLLFTGRKDKFPAKEVAARSPEAGWRMMPRCADLAAPRFGLASSLSRKPHIRLWWQWQWGRVAHCWRQPHGKFVGVFSPALGPWISMNMDPSFI